MKCLNVFFRKMLMILALILSSWNGSISGYQPQDFTLPRVGESHPQMSTNVSKDPEQGYENSDRESSSFFQLPDSSVSEKPVPKPTSKQSSSELATPQDSPRSPLDSELDENSLGLTLATGPNASALTGEETGKIEDNTQQDTNESRLIGHHHEMPYPDSSVYDSTEMLGDHGEGVDEHIRSNSTLRRSPDGSKSQDDTGPESSEGRSSNEPEVKPGILFHSPHSPSPQGATDQNGTYTYRNPNASFRDVIVNRLPTKLRMRIAITDFYDHKLLQGYVDDYSKSPNHIVRNLQDYDRSKLMERIALRNLIAKAKNETAQLIADYKALRNGRVSNEVRLNPNFRSFFENVSVGRIAYENVKRSELSSLEEYLGDSNRSVNETEAGEDNILENIGSGDSENDEGEQVTVGSGDGGKTPEYAMRLMKRNVPPSGAKGNTKPVPADGVTASPGEEEEEGEEEEDQSSPATVSTSTAPVTAATIAATTTDATSKVWSKSVIISTILVFGSILELVLVTCCVCKDRMFGSTPTTPAAPGTTPTPGAKPAPGATPAPESGAKVTTVTVTTTKK